MGFSSTASALLALLLISTPCLQLAAAATQADDAAALLQFQAAAGFAAATGWSGQQPCATGAGWAASWCKLWIGQLSGVWKCPPFC